MAAKGFGKGKSKRKGKGAAVAEAVPAAPAAGPPPGPVRSMKHQECFHWKKPEGCVRGDACPYAHASIPKAKAPGGKGAAAVAFLCFGVPRAPLAAVTLASALASAARVDGTRGKSL
eukprot:62083-Heterocapsa_arctica.AAC.1